VPTMFPFRPHCLAVLVLTLASIAACKKENAYVPPPPPQVGVAKPAQKPVTPYLELTGSMSAFNQVDLVARVQGFLQEINYKDGADAKRGDTLFIIEPAPYQSKLQQAQAQLAATQASLVQSTAEYNRQAQLGRSDFASQSAVDQARAKRDADQANLTNLQAGVTLAAINLGYTRVTAPFDGVVTAHAASVGQLVGVTSPTQLATIVQLDPIYVTFNISEQDVLRIRDAMIKRGARLDDLSVVPIEVGLMTEEGYPYKGKLDYAAPNVDASTGTLMVRGILPNPEESLLPGFFARIRVPLQLEPSNALLVPDTALGADQAGRYVLVVNKDNVVEQRKVEPGQLDGTLRVITSGLTPDDQVVVSGLQRAVAGSKVAPQVTQIATPAAPAAAPAPAKQ
jgi:membrane fusion protein, multidrug efflux system